MKITSSEGTKDMAINPNFISPCGLYCGVCAIYIAARDNNIKLKERLANLYKGGTPGKGTLPNSDKLSTENIHCGGCLSDDLFMHCQHIDNFSMAVGKKVILRCVPYRRQFGTEKWVRDEEATTGEKLLDKSMKHDNLPLFTVSCFISLSNTNCANCGVCGFGGQEACARDAWQVVGMT
jgi:ferredoxin